VIKENTKTR